MAEARIPGQSRTSLAGPPLLSVVVPVLNEAAHILPLVAEIRAALRDACAFEVIYVDDGSTDGTRERLREAAGETPELRVVRHNRSFGQSAALRSGVLAARGSLVDTLDGDGQNDPADIPRLLEVQRSHAGRRRLMVTGNRVDRKDSAMRRLVSRVGNAVRRRVLRDDNPDTGCSLKLFERELFLTLPYFDHMHRFLPALARREDCEIRVVPVSHRPRTAGRSKYTTLGRLLVGIPDLVGVLWLIRRFPHGLEREEQA